MIAILVLGIIVLGLLMAGMVGFWIARDLHRCPASMVAPAYLVQAWEASADSARPVEGPDGTPPVMHRFDYGDADASFRGLRQAEAWHGLVVVEAAWQDPCHAVLVAAYGEPGRTYDLQWPGCPRLRWVAPAKGHSLHEL